MPHITIEATQPLIEHVDVNGMQRELHAELSNKGLAVLSDLKSRVHVAHAHLAGMDSTAQFLVARLSTTNPRPSEELEEMGAIVLATMRKFVEATKPSAWWQCCVFIEPHVKT